MEGDVGGVLREAQRAAAEAITMGDLVAGPVAILCRHLDAHICAGYTLRPEGIDLVTMPGEDYISAQYLREGGDDPLLQVKVRFNPRLAVTTDLVERRGFRRSHVYREFYRRHDIEHQLVARLTPLEYPVPGLIAAVLGRSEQRGSFTEAERAIVGNVLPALASAARRIDRLGRIAAERDVLSVLAARDGIYAAFGLDGRVSWLSPDAARELAVHPLPDELGACLARMRELVGRDDGGSVPAGGGALALPTTDGRRRLVDAALMRKGDGWLVVLYLASSDVSSTVARAAAHHGLRPSESRVLEGLSHGRSNAEIARELFVSCETVRTHVHQLLRKMRASTRLEAVARLRRFR